MFPKIKRVYPTLASSKLVSVQPMGLPTRNIFHLDFVYGGNKKQNIINDAKHNMDKLIDIINRL